MQACSQHCLVLGLNQLPVCVASLQLWLHLSCQCECYHLIMPGHIKWQIQLRLERISNSVSQDLAMHSTNSGLWKRLSTFTIQSKQHSSWFGKPVISTNSAIIQHDWQNHRNDLRFTYLYFTWMLINLRTSSKLPHLHSDTFKLNETCTPDLH